MSTARSVPVDTVRDGSVLVIRGCRLMVVVSEQIARENFILFPSPVFQTDDVDGVTMLLQFCC